MPKVKSRKNIRDYNTTLSENKLGSKEDLFDCDHLSAEIKTFRVISSGLVRPQNDHDHTYNSLYNPYRFLMYRIYFPTINNSMKSTDTIN